MSLNYDLGKIENYKAVTQTIADHDRPGDYKAGDKIMNPVTHTLIWATVGIGLGEITEENVYEFYGRLRIQESLNGAYRKRAVEGGSGLEDDPVTLDEVKKHIGLTTNVFPKRAHSEFLKQVFSEVARGDKGELKGWTDDYQKLVQWGRTLVDTAYNDDSYFRPSEAVLNKMAQELPDRDRYPMLSKDGAELQECDDCGEQYRVENNSDDIGLCPKCGEQ